MADLQTATRPDDQRDEYAFIKNMDTGRSFKVLQEIDSETQKQPLLKLSISPVDEAGKAMRLENGEPDITNHTHVFTEHELGAPDFDLNLRSAAIVQDMVDRHERQIVARDTLAASKQEWAAGDVDLTVEVPEHMKNNGGL